ncbi:MAG: GNAT family N-acetyltransferase [Ruminococcus sp.]|nr:GNAT family N-acetyltransferase [Ruminococcus sp.]
MKRISVSTGRIRALFDCFDDSMIQSCFEGVYGELWCDDEDDPQTAVIVSGDFHYLAGKPAYADEVMAFAKDKPHAVFVPSCDGWFGLLNASCDNSLRKVDRYHMRAPENGFDRQQLKQILKALRPLRLYACDIFPIGEKEFNECRKSSWAYSFVSNFSDYKEFEQHGFGFVIKHLGKIVSGTSTYCYYSRGVEVEVSTDKEYRMRGLAKVTAARFILECVDRGLAPNWDARNMASVSIARKLGFVLHDTYTAYEFKVPDDVVIMPKDKFDSEAVERLARLDDEQLTDLVPQLLEWIQDMNWTVAQHVTELLADRRSITEPHLAALLSPGQTDAQWKFNIIKHLLGIWHDAPCDEQIMQQIKRIAQHPTDSEKAELVDEAAKEFLEDLA